LQAIKLPLGTCKQQAENRRQITGKLNNEKIFQILNRTGSQRAIASEFGITQGMVGLIKRGLTGYTPIMSEFDAEYQ
jgi:hypothetical protein